MEDIANGDGFKLTLDKDRKIIKLKRLQLATITKNDFDILTETLNVYRDNGKFITDGITIKIDSLNSIEYVVLRCDPSGGYLSEDTLVYVEECVPSLKRVDLLLTIYSNDKLRDVSKLLLPEYTTHEIYREDLINLNKVYGPYKVTIDKSNKDKRLLNTIERCIFRPIKCDELKPIDDLHTFGKKLFNALFEKYLSKSLARQLRIIYFGQCLTLGNFSFHISNTTPTYKPGYIDENTVSFYYYTAHTPDADLREAEGEVNRRGSTASGKDVTLLQRALHLRSILPSALPITYL